ncbi:spermatogenesis-associated protein 22-like isoform X2 [Pecten maximus]|nr:spermatogenesis-associated protein 22-like isoform X2 [Pecten maximus]XP_033748543.1 spermatogenesis-associated protein 22-like isoform X2 [Pecten maximus]
MNRKRPRQAIIADPQNIDGAGTGMPINASQSSHHYPDLMPVHGFDGKGYIPSQPKQGNQKSYQQQNKSQQNPHYQQPNRQQLQQNQQYSYNTNRPTPGRQPQTLNSGLQGPNRAMTGGITTCRTGQAQSNSNRQLSGQSNQGWQANKQQSWSSGQASYTNKQGANSFTDVQKIQQKYPNVGNNKTESYGQQQTRNFNGRQNYNGQGGSQCQTQNSGNNFSKTNTHMNQNPFQTSTHRNQNLYRPGPSGAATAQKADKFVQHFRHQTDQVGGFGDSSKTISSSTIQKEQQKAPQKTGQKADKSLHLITSTIQGVKHWSKYRDSVNMIFEVFGVVDSAMMQDPSATGKEFLIKDEEDSMACIFYEIDRQLQRLTRGHWHRCVGSMDGRSGKLKCVSVRPASMEEKDLSKVSIKKSDDILWNLTKTTPEP